MQHSLQEIRQTALQPPFSTREVFNFWQLGRKEQIETLETYAGFNVKNWNYPRPTICIGVDEVLFGYFVEKFMGQCASTLGVFDPLHVGNQNIPFYSFATRHTNGEPQYLKI